MTNIAVETSESGKLTPFNRLDLLHIVTDGCTGVSGVQDFVRSRGRVDGPSLVIVEGVCPLRS